MKSKVKEMMTAISNLAVVDEDSTLFEVILAIGAANGDASNNNGMRDPAALVTNVNSEITGVLDFRNILKGLEPRYTEIVDTVEEGTVSPEWIRSELKKHGLWVNVFDDICSKAGEIITRNLMTIPEESQMANADSSLNEALFQMMITGNDYLFVRDGAKLMGIIKLSDIAKHVGDTVKACRV